LFWGNIEDYQSYSVLKCKTYAKVFGHAFGVFTFSSDVTS
jgi:hypothetical protein